MKWSISSISTILSKSDFVKVKGLLMKVGCGNFNSEFNLSMNESASYPLIKKVFVFGFSSRSITLRFGKLSLKEIQKSPLSKRPRLAT